MVSILLIMEIKRHRLVQIGVFFQEKKSLLQCIYFHFKTAIKQVLVLFQSKAGKSV